MRTKRKYTYRTQPIPDATRIRKWVYTSGLTIREIEAQSGVARRTLYRMMLGHRVRIPTLKKLAKLMGVDWRKLIKRW